jgi:AraC family transcriptional regulator
MVDAADRRDDFPRRFQRVLDHIDGHTDEAFDLDTLSALAAYSPHHFHRQFGALVGLPLGRYVTFSRMKRASYLLAFHREVPVGEIAALCGYEGPEAFARAFRQVVGAAPTAFRAQPDWIDWHARFRPWLETRTRPMLAPSKTMNVEIVDFPATRIALLTHRGDHARLNDSLQRFIGWRRRANLPRDRHATFNILYADPHSTPPEDFRMGVAVATDDEIAPNEDGIEPSMLPAGPCARVRHIGSTDFLEPVFQHLYGEWLPASGREPRDFPPFLQRVKFYPDVPEADAVTDIFVPLTP